MDIIVKHFTEAVIGVFTLSFFILLVFHASYSTSTQGLFPYIGEKISVKEKKDPIEIATNAFQKEAMKKDAYILFDHNIQRMKVGETYALDSYFHAYDYTDQRISFQLIQIKDAKDQVKNDVYNENKNTVCFQKAGIYELEFETKDTTNRLMKICFHIPVTRK